MTDEAIAEVPQPVADTYELTITGNGLSVKRSVSEAVALSLIATVMGGVQPARTGAVFGAGGGRGSAAGGPPIGPGEYLTASGAKRHPEKILAFGAYLTDHMGREAFTREEVRALFQRAAEPMPANFTRDFTTAVANRWIEERSDASGSFYVTSPGRAALQGKFGGDTGTPARARRRRRKPKAAGDADKE